VSPRAPVGQAKENDMHLTAHLDLDVIAHQTDSQVSVLVELAAPDDGDRHGRPASALQVVLDRSGSMAGARLDAAKTSLLALVDRLDPRDRLGLVTFDQQATIAVPAGPLTDKVAVKRAIADIRDGGSTDLSGGYFRGLQEARRVAGPGGTTLLLISDGHANAGLCDPRQLGDVARKAHAEGITTTTLGMGLGYDERLLSAIAAGGAGNEHFAENADSAVALVAGEVDGLLSMAVQAGALVVKLSPHVRGIHVLNELPSIVAVPEGLLIELGSLYAGETRSLVITFDVPAIPALGLAEIASLEFSYVALPALEQHTVTVPLHVNVVPGDQAAGRIADPSVRTEVAFQRAQRAKREASAAMSAGDSRSAGRSLRRAQQLLGEACASAPAPMAAELAEDLAVVARLQEEMDSGQLARAAKFSSADAAAKSRTRGRDRRSA
jgi:Ca-activated chloride channel family protein